MEKEEKNQIPEILKDNSRMSATFVELEENILKLMESKQNIEKETEKMIMENKAELLAYEERERQVRKERDLILTEKIKDDKMIKDLKKQTESEGGNFEVVKMIRDLYCMAMFGEDYDMNITAKKFKQKPSADLLKELNQYLQKFEFDLIDYIAILEKISVADSESFKKVVHFQKEMNKRNKRNELEKKSAAIANFKKKKQEERMDRVIVKGRKVMEHILVSKADKKKMLNQSINKGNEDINMIFYDNND